VVVVDGETPELSEEAAASLAKSLSAQFEFVRRPDAGPFWDHNGLLFASTKDVRAVTAQLIKVRAVPWTDGIRSIRYAG